MKIILDLCGGTGAWSKPYKDNGYDVRVLTLPYFNVERWRDDEEFVALLHSNTIYGILAAPPCTQFSIARNDSTALKPRDMREGLKTVQACLDIIHECLFQPYRKSENNLKFWALENPYSGYLKRFLGEPPYTFDPNEFGDTHTKHTGLWGMFNPPLKRERVKVEKGDENNYVKSIERHIEKVRYLIPEGYKEATRIPERIIARSITPQGFAKAFMEANK